MVDGLKCPYCDTGVYHPARLMKGCQDCLMTNNKLTISDKEWKTIAKLRGTYISDLYHKMKYEGGCPSCGSDSAFEYCAEHEFTYGVDKKVKLKAWVPQIICPMCGEGFLDHRGSASKDAVAKAHMIKETLKELIAVGWDMAEIGNSGYEDGQELTKSLTEALEKAQRVLDKK